MKKKIFSTLVLFASLALTACGGGNAQSSSVASECKTHKWIQDPTKENVEATCKAEGITYQVCQNCGQPQEKKVKQLDHVYDEGKVTTQATCATPGVMTYTCTLCQDTKTEPINADHQWGQATPVAGGETEAAYNLFTCSACGTAKKIEIAAVQETGKSAIDGSLKADSSFPGYMKLSSNGNSVTYTFNTTVGGQAKIYMRGVMDYWHDGNNENQTRNFYSGKNSQDGNFKLEVNGGNVDYSATKNLTYEDMLPGESTVSGYSPLGDALVGTCTVNNGANTVKFTRTESYNMLIKDFVIIIG